MNIPTYIEVIGKYYPLVCARSSGPAYEDLLLVPGATVAIPSKDELDSKIKEQTTEHMWDSIKADRDLRTQTGGSKVGNYWFHSDQASRTQQIALVILGAGIPSTLMWKTMSGVFVPMTPTLAQQVFGAAVMLDQNVFKAAEIHRARMSASDTPWSYDFSTGWPLTYEESLIT